MIHVELRFTVQHFYNHKLCNPVILSELWKCVLTKLKMAEMEYRAIIYQDVVHMYNRLIKRSDDRIAINIMIWCTFCL